MSRALAVCTITASSTTAAPWLLPPGAQPKEPTLEKTASQSMLKVDDTFIYTIKLTFTDTTSGVIITDSLPSGIDFGTVPPNDKVTWTSTSTSNSNPSGGECQCDGMHHHITNTRQQEPCFTPCHSTHSLLLDTNSYSLAACIISSAPAAMQPSFLILMPTLWPLHCRMHNFRKELHL
jgi:uncharacterized repeat protein (TIGR01451 family)